ncbi:MAG: hypothetical protein J2O47_02940 [Acidimicrobiaceae bacterium]|nr:hypothetical protein [Acidimicrobiaceae bacterium]
MDTTWLLEVRRYQGDQVDAHGNQIPLWGAPQPWPVYYLAPGPSSEITDRTREEAVRIVWNIGAPATPAVPGERDLVVVDGEEFEVEGRPADYTHTPWPPHPTAGVVVELHRVEG